jgi:hypothetical protein
MTAIVSYMTCNIGKLLIVNENEEAYVSIKSVKSLEIGDATTSETS